MRLASTLVASFIPAVVAYPQISSPSAGSRWNTGKVTVKWTDVGSPSIDVLSSYTIQLIVGGNEGINSQAIPTIVQTGSFSSTLTKFEAQGSLDANVAGSTENGFYLKMTCSVSDGGQIIVYSDRFSIPTLTGTTDAPFAEAVAALGGSTAGPPAQNNIHNHAAGPVADAAVVPPAAPAGAAVDSYTIPYYLQVGPTKYAPMQSIPPTSITAKSYSPLFPTSSVTIAKTFLPLATIVSTMTLAQTFSVHSVENSASAQALPSDDMAKFLARWKD